MTNSKTRPRAYALGGWSVLLLALAACGGEGGEAPPPAESTPPAAEPTAAPPAAPDPAPAPPAETPASFRVQFETSKGNFVVQVDRAMAPNGADRIYRLVSEGFYDEVRFFRVMSGFMAQFGIHGDPAVNTRWRSQPIQDDPVNGSNTRGMVTFAMSSQPNSRTTQIFINLVDNVNLDGSGFAPFGRVVEGMEVVDQLYSGYGEGAPRGNGPAQGQAVSEGNAYLTRDFPLLDYVIRATIVGG
jgi:peptidyl-prolyl cis-trans isomerase A (cyclophilin A)